MDLGDDSNCFGAIVGFHPGQPVTRLLQSQIRKHMATPTSCYAQFRIPSCPTCMFWEQWGEAGVAGENPQRHLRPRGEKHVNQFTVVTLDRKQLKGIFFFNVHLLGYIHPI